MASSNTGTNDENQHPVQQFPLHASFVRTPSLQGNGRRHSLLAGAAASWRNDVGADTVATRVFVWPLNQSRRVVRLLIAQVRETQARLAGR
jgi:hypothetical protein